MVALLNGVLERDFSFTLMRWQSLYTAVVLTVKVVEAQVVKMSDNNNNNNNNLLFSRIQLSR